MKIVGVMDEDPFHWQTWSGSSPYLFGAMRDLGVLHGAVAAELPRLEKRLYQALNFQPGRRAWRYKFNLDTRYYAALTRRAAGRLRRFDGQFDAVLQVGAWYDMSRSTNRPVCSYHDGNLAVMLRSPYPRPAIAARHVSRALDWERTLYSRMRLVFPMSNWLADSFIRDNGVPSERVHPVGAGVNLPHVRATEGRNHDAPNLLFVGKDFIRKGGPDLLQAFAMVRREVPAAQLTIIGPRIAAPPAGVRSLGMLSKHDPRQLEQLLDEYSRATVFVMPSLYEPFGIAFAEAMAHRVPCIGTDICAMPEIIEHGRTGYVVPPGSPEQLAGRMLDLLKDPARCQAFGEAGYLRYQERFTWNAVAGRIAGLMAGIC